MGLLGNEACGKDSKGIWIIDCQSSLILSSFVPSPPHPLTPSSPPLPLTPSFPHPLISSLPLPSSPHPAWPDPQLSRSQEVPSYIKQEKHSAWFSAVPRGHQHPGPVGLRIMMIQSLQANPQALPCLWQLCCQQGAGR